MKDGLTEIMRLKGIEMLTSLQRKALEPIYSGRSALIIAPTGSGKTEAALIPLFLRHLKDKKKSPLRGFGILYIAPLRALNRDLLRRVEEWCAKMGITVSVRHSDTPQSERTRQSIHPPEMLITTPETLQILFSGKRLKEHLRSVRSVVVDEIHELYGEDRGVQLAVALERLEELSGPVQRIGLSATVENPKEVARFLVGEREMPVIIADNTPKRQELRIYPAREREDDRDLSVRHRIPPRALDALKYIKEGAQEVRKVLIFTNTRDSSEAFGSWFHNVYPDFPVEVHHGSLSRDIRTKVEESFKRGELKALICTSSMELGIDIGDVDRVYQISSPRRVERLIQRVGRSGHSLRGVSRGEIIAFSFDDILESVALIKRTEEGLLEEKRPREKPIIVLVNQILAMVLSEKSLDVGRLYALLRRSRPFRKLRFKELMEVIEFLKSLRILSYDPTGGTIRSTRRTRTYFYSNISMIPDERSYKLKDLSSGRLVGQLDEKFVASFIAPGARFILYGRVWEVVSVEEDSILISPVAGSGEIPNWVGEDIPVDFHVAQDVGRLREDLEGVARGTSSLDEVSRKWGVEEGVLKAPFEIVKKQVEEGLVVPTHRRVTVEEGNEEVIINACVGTEVAEALSKIVAGELQEEGIGGVMVEIDPYRIVLRSAFRVRGKDVVRILLGMAPSNLRHKLTKYLSSSMLFRWQILHVAKKIGIVEREVSLKDLNMNRLIERLEGTIAYREAIERILQERMDIRNTTRFLKRIERGEIEVHLQRSSPIGLSYRDARRELLYSGADERTILAIIEKRLEVTPLTMVCLACQRRWRASAGGGAPLQCPVCSSRRVAALHPMDYERMEKHLQRRDFASLSRSDRKRLSLSADLVMAHGRDALLVLAGRGVGPTEAARILSFPHENREELLKAIRKAEITYARNRQFWS